MNFLARRLLHGGFVLLAMSLLVFITVYAIGNPVDLLVDPQADRQDVERTIRALGLDQPMWIQYLLFLKGALTGNLGNSFIHGVPAMQLILERMPATMELALAAMFITVTIGLPLGLWAGIKPKSKIARGFMALSLLGYSLPTFWVGLMLIMIFAVQLGWLPPGGREATGDLAGISLSIFSVGGWRYLLLPALTLALFNTALLMRMVRSATRNALGRDYVRYARARGLHEMRIVNVHVLKNILIPIVTVLGLEFGSLIAFAVVTETIFGWPGMGKLLIDSINVLDRPVIVAYLLVTAALFVCINLIVDMLYVVLDPRVRLGDDPGNA
jgi:peptide/nickel transport system permease protein